MNTPLHKDSWQYRQLNVQNPGLKTLPGGLSALVAEGHPVMACTADLQYPYGS